jgi:hypothetical protein
LPAEAAAGDARLVIGIPASAQFQAAGLLNELRERAGEWSNRAPLTVLVASSAPDATSTGGSPGGSVVDVRQVPVARRPADALTVPYHGIPDRARAIHAIFSEALQSGATGCVIVDPRTTALEGWIDGFFQALRVEHAQFVSPVYPRHPFNAGLVHGVLAPMFDALYGARVRYPAALHFACSSQLIAATLDDPVWDTGLGQTGIDQWLLATAIESGGAVAQAGVGAALSPDRFDVGLSSMITQLVGVLFAEMERRARTWQRVRATRAVPISGAALSEPPAPPVDPAALVETFRRAHRDLEDAVWAEVLPPLGILQWRRLATASLDAFRVADNLWARTLYDFALAHRLRVIARDHLLASLTPLYLAWLASFMLEQEGAPLPALEERLDRLTTAFAAEKPYLVAQWRWPERFRPAKMRR